MADEKTHTIVTENPNDSVDIEVAMQMHDLGVLRGLSICFPATVLSYDRQSHIAQVLPLVKEGVYKEKWEYLTRQPISVSVRSVQHGGFTIDVPLYVGDTGWVISADRDTSLLKQNGGLPQSVLAKNRMTEVVTNVYPQKPVTQSLHSSAHGLFIPDNWGKWETDRWKDSKEVKIDKALCIGQAIGTKEQEQPAQYDKENENPNGVKVSPQSGTQYDENTSSSLVLERYGGIHLLSSSKEEDKQTARVTVKGNQIESEVKDDKDNISVKSSFSLEDGMEVIRETKKSNFSFTYKDGVTKIETTSEDNKKVTIEFNNGEMTVKSEGDSGINIRTLAHTNVNAGEDVKIQSSNAMVNVASGYVLSNGICAVTAGGNLHLQGNYGMDLCAGRNINIEAGNRFEVSGIAGIHCKGVKELTFSAQDPIEIVSSDMNTVAADITDTDRKSTLYFGIDMKSLNINLGDKITIENGRLKIDAGSEISIEAANISINANDSIDISGSIDIQDVQKGSINGTQGWTWRDSEGDITYKVDENSE